VTTTQSAPGVNLDTIINEALVLRRGIELPTIDQGPVEVLARLIAVRSRLDRVEELLSTVARFRGQVRSQHKDATAEFDEAWASQITSANRRGRGSDGWSDPAPRERYATADVATLDLKRRVRQLDKILDTANDAIYVIERVQRGLDSTRMDLHLILRAMSVETQLER
jgi:hypothetical protein